MKHPVTYWYTFLFLIVSLNIFGQIKSIRPKVCIANFGKDSMRVSVKEILKDPVLRICNSKEDFKIIKYNLITVINGVIYEGWNEKNDTLYNDIIQKMPEVIDSMWEYNQLLIRNVLYQRKDNSIDTAEGLYLWLSNGGGRNGYYDIDKEYYKNGRIHFKYWYCNDTCIKVEYYGKNGGLRGIERDNYIGKDSIRTTTVYRKDGSEILYVRELNGQDDGDYNIYYRNGLPRLESTNIRGIRILERLYDKKGRLTQESTCDTLGNNGYLKYYDKNGNVKKEGTCKYVGLKNKIVF